VKLKNRIFLLILCALGARATHSQAPTAIAVGVTPRPVADFDVVIAAPPVVSVVSSPVISVSVMVRRKDSSKEKPAKLIFLASDGLACQVVALGAQNTSSFQRGVLALDGTQSVNTVLVSLQDIRKHDSFSVSIFTADAQTQLVAQQKIQVRRPSRVEFQSVPADGEMMGLIAFRALDQNGEALPDAQFFLRDTDPVANADIVQRAVTDAKGKAVFQLPAFTQGAHLLPQLTFVSPGNVLFSSQFDVIYRDANNATEKPVVPNLLWWKKGWTLE